MSEATYKDIDTTCSQNSERKVSNEELLKEIRVNREETRVIRELMLTIIRKQRPGKAAELPSLIERLGQMKTNDVKNHFGISDTGARKLLEKVGQQPGFRLIRGDSKNHTQTKVIYDKSKIILDHNKKIAQMFKDRKLKDVTMHDIISDFGCKLSEAKDIARTFLETNSQVEFADGDSKLRWRNDE